MSENSPTAVEERLKVEVDAEALGDLLRALMGPGHLIRELMVIHSLDEKGLSDKPGPIKLLVDQYNAFVHKTNGTTEGNSNGN
uniref:Uncharacterized protein n=1 Tax=Burkholderia phage vB_BgluM-SURPRISE13 TaxID=3159457 RepID=A0AAU7PG64_9VIRU